MVVHEDFVVRPDGTPGMQSGERGLKYLDKNHFFGKSYVDLFENSGSHNLALLRLSRPARLSRGEGGVWPICLPPPKPDSPPAIDGGGGGGGGVKVDLVKEEG